MKHKTWNQDKNGLYSTTDGGRTRTYYQAGGKIKKVLTYNDEGLLHGWCKFYDNAGNLQYQQEWVNGKNFLGVEG